MTLMAVVLVWDCGKRLVSTIKRFSRKAKDESDQELKDVVVNSGNEADNEFI